MKQFVHPSDPYQMNWIEGSTEWGTVKAPKELSIQIEQTSESDGITERYIFTNTANYDVFTSLKDISIYTPFNDDYVSSAICVKNRCHTHIWCGENVSYIMALRMGGEAPHLGMVLIEGSLGGYSVERDLSQRSNDRGDFLLHPSPVSLAPNESFSLCWKLFWHDGKTDFFRKAAQYNPHFLEIHAEQFTYFSGETISFQIIPAFPVTKEDILITKGKKTLPYELINGKILVTDTTSALGEQLYHIHIADIQTHCRILVLPALDELAAARCRYIAQKQQYHKKGSHLDGAFLIYDIQEGHCYYNPTNDFNGARERMGMGILLAAYLQKHPDENLENSLKDYMKYIEREIFDEKTSIVCNDYQKNNSYQRLYNYPWLSTLYLEIFDLWKNENDVKKAYHIMKSFYRQGGTKFYAIEIPLEKLLLSLKKLEMQEEYESILACFTEHCNTILQNDILYPAHEVNFEQSIVAPAAHILLQMYRITHNCIYLEGAKKQLAILELFHCSQPDYHMHQVAIRHWDGYWFGKNRMYGDTYPHYWSALTGNVYHSYAQISGQKEYELYASQSLRGVLSLFFPDGSASCAYVYPITVNGQEAHRYDPYANDQDWGLYFMLRFSYQNGRGCCKIDK